jgi:predicted nuclease of restriction endonuclease-like (RecB) superfamily
MKYEILVDTIQKTHQHFQQQAAKAVNVSLTLRNWLIGFYIVEFEQKGEERASYGQNLIKNLSESLAIKGFGETNLKLSRQFYVVYPELRAVLGIYRNELPHRIRQTLSDESVSATQQISQLPTDQLQTPDKQSIIPFDGLENTDAFLIDLVKKVSFSHFVELIKIEDGTKRKFFELIILKTTPSVQELKRQINTLAYERVGLSQDLDLATNQLLGKIEPTKVEDSIKNIYLFDFLGIRNNGLIEETDLEAALVNHLQEFILELGNGFCFEARQKRILIDDTYFFADLVFYHRILKCHVIIEIKVDAFAHQHLSQLNTYVAYYNAEVKQKDDNPAVGILLCTEKGQKLVEYATAGMDNHLFVSKYLLQLPNKDKLEEFIITEMKKWKQ